VHTRKVHGGDISHNRFVRKRRVFTWGRRSYCEHSRVNLAEVYETASLERSTYFIVGVALYRAIFSVKSVYLLAAHKPSLEYPINVYDLINALSPRCLTTHLASDRSRTHDFVSERSRAVLNHRINTNTYDVHTHT